MRRSWILLAVLLASAIGSAASACTCDGNDDVAAQLARAELVFFGEVTTHHDASMVMLQTRYWEFAVQGVWKGPAQPKLRIYAHGPGGEVSDCDREFEVGRSYMVFAERVDGHEGRYRAQLCSGTVRADSAMSVLRVLGRPAHRY